MQVRSEKKLKVTKFSDDIDDNIPDATRNILTLELSARSQTSDKATIYDDHASSEHQSSYFVSSSSNLGIGYHIKNLRALQKCSSKILSLKKANTDTCLKICQKQDSSQNASEMRVSHDIFFIAKQLVFTTAHNFEKSEMCTRDSSHRFADKRWKFTLIYSLYYNPR